MNLNRLKNLWQQALNCRPSLSDWPLFLQGTAISAGFGWLFYDSVLAAVLLLPLALFWFVYQKKRQRQRDRRIVGIQFKDLMSSVLTCLRAGYSPENAFVEARYDMQLLYGKRSLICFHLDRLTKGLRNNVPLEKLILKMAKDTENDDIRDFAEVFAVAKKSGGSMTQMLSRTIDVISRKVEVEKEIDVLISAKRMEARIMNLVPFFIIFYISITSSGFFDPLYHNFFGIIFMTLCAGVYTAAYLMSERIVNIDV